MYSQCQTVITVFAFTLFSHLILFVFFNRVLKQNINYIFPSNSLIKYSMQIPNKHFQATMGEMPTTSLVLPVILRPILSQVSDDV